MSKKFLTVAQAYAKLGLSGGDTSLIRKSDLVATGKCDVLLLNKYENPDFVVDDDVVLAMSLAPLFETTSFVPNFGKYTYSSEIRNGYYVGAVGSISAYQSQNNWALDAFYVRSNSAGSPLVIHRGFNLANYQPSSLHLVIELTLAGGTDQFTFSYAWGESGFHGWNCLAGNPVFTTYLSERLGTVIKKVTLRYHGVRK